MNPALIAILACPACKGPIQLIDDEQALCCEACAVAYPIVDGIPVLLREEAVPMDEWRRQVATNQQQHKPEHTS